MKLIERYMEITPTEHEDAELERLGSGMVKRDDEWICLLAQTDDETVWGIADSNGNLLVTEAGNVDNDTAQAIEEIATVVPDSYAQGFVVRVYSDEEYDQIAAMIATA